MEASLSRRDLFLYAVVVPIALTTFPVALGLATDTEVFVSIAWYGLVFPLIVPLLAAAVAVAVSAAVTIRRDLDGHEFGRLWVAVAVGFALASYLVPTFWLFGVASVVCRETSDCF